MTHRKIHKTKNGKRSRKAGTKRSANRRQKSKRSIKRRQNGGSFAGPSFQQMPIHTYYALNEHGQNDPSMPNNIVDARLAGGSGKFQETLVVGNLLNSVATAKELKPNGKSRKNKKRTGGGLFTNIFLGAGMEQNPIANQGNLNNVSSLNIITGEDRVNPLVTVQSIGHSMNKPPALV